MTMRDLTFKEFLHYFGLICNSNACENCPMNDLECGMPDESEAAKYEEIIKKWIQEHPEPQAVSEACAFIKNLPVSEFGMTYEQGIEDAWDFMKRLVNKMTYKGYREIYDIEEPDGGKTIAAFLNKYTMHEAMEKLQNWQDAQVKIGDVIDYNNGEKIGYVSSVEDDGHIKVFFPDSDIWYGFITQDIVKKTGRNVARELNNFLDVVKGEEDERIH